MHVQDVYQDHLIFQCRILVSVVKLTLASQSSYLILVGPILSALSVFFILSYLLLFSFDIAISISVILFSLLSGLSSYLQTGKDNFKKESKDLIKNNGTFHDGSYHNKQYDEQKNRLSNLIFIIMYILSILIIGTSKPLAVTDELYLAWD